VDRVLTVPPVPQANGWYLIFAVIIVYNLQPHVEKFLDDRHQRVSMAESRREMPKPCPLVIGFASRA
jgi:hypothetical protein